MFQRKYNIWVLENDSICGEKSIDIYDTHAKNYANDRKAKKKWQKTLFGSSVLQCIDYNPCYKMFFGKKKIQFEINGIVKFLYNMKEVLNECWNFFIFLFLLKVFQFKT